MAGIFFYVRISIKEKFKYIITLLLLNFITLPLSRFNKFYKRKQTGFILCEGGFEGKRVGFCMRSLAAHRIKASHTKTNSFPFEVNL